MPLTVLTLAFSTALSFATALILGPVLIRWLKNHQHKQPIRDCGPESHAQKAGTPTMGGLFILPAITLASLLFAPINLPLIVTLTTMWLFALIGFVDDWYKVVKKNHSGLKGKTRLLLESVLAIGLFSILALTTDKGSTLSIPYFQVTIDIGWLFRFIVTYFVVVGTSNAVNLTDGLDGLVIVPVALVCAAFSGIAFFSDNIAMHSLSIVAAAIVGAGIGFLWFNAKPARIFMGDTGSLGLGAAIAVIALYLNVELLLVIMGFLFVAEALSVILQVASFKCFRRRIFKMAPLHHHFELSGWSETQVTVRAWIVTLFCVCIGMLDFWV